MKYKCKIEITDEDGYKAIIQGDMIGLESEIEYTQIIDDNHAVEMFGFPITKTIYKVGFEGKVIFFEIENKSLQEVPNWITGVMEYEVKAPMLIQYKVVIEEPKQTEIKN